MTHPLWALKHKKPGTELRCINGKYYLYEVTSRWNPDKKRAQKITGKLLGRITEKEGFIESGKKIISLKSKNYGAFAFVLNEMKESIDVLKQFFPDEWQQIISASFFRLLYRSPLKNMAFFYQSNYLSEWFEVSLEAKQIAKMLRMIGFKRDKILAFLGTFIHKKQDQYLLIDVTSMHSYSSLLPIAKIGYNTKRDFNPQVNLMLIFSSILTLPVYYRILPGNIRDVKAFKTTLEESGIHDAIIIADKGFYSKDNLSHLDASELNYILPLRRNNKILDYTAIRNETRQDMDGYFKYTNRYIWYTVTKRQNKQIIIFLNEWLKSKEAQDYLARIDTHPENSTLERYRKKSISFGTFAVITNLEKETPEQIYRIYKTRIAVEKMAHVFKNILMVDRSYMRDEYTLEGWVFINYLALFWYYRIFNLLNQHDLLPKLSPQDLLTHLNEIKKIKINDNWYTAEITSSTEKLLKKLNLHIT